MILEPYNAMLSMQQLMENSNGTYCIASDALHDVCLWNLCLTQPTYKNLNHLVSVSTRWWKWLHSSAVLSYDMTSTYVIVQMKNLNIHAYLSVQDYFQCTYLLQEDCVHISWVKTCFLCYFEFINGSSYQNIMI